MDDLQTIQGKFVSIRYRNEQSGFTVASFRLHGLEEKNITITGLIPEFQMDLLYECSGSFIEHAKYGMQFSIIGMKILRPSDEEALVNYFSGTSFSGIGKKSAQKIIDKLGLQAISLIQADPTVLYDVFKVNDKRIQAVIEGIENTSELDDSMMFFNQIGLGVRNLLKVQVVYGEEAIEVIRNNPYQLIEDIDGIGFKTADKIANQLGFEKDHPYRLKALMISCLLEGCIKKGDSYLLLEEFKRSLSATLRRQQIEDYSFDFESCFENLLVERFLILEEDRLYHHTQYDAEHGIAQFLVNFPYAQDYSDPINNFSKAVKQCEQELNIKYDAKQKEAIAMFFDEPFSILTGGPGTGKTTIVRAILKLYQSFYPLDNVVLCAPTGRASKRLSECSEYKASTIHRLLKWDLETNTFLVNEMEPLMVDCLIIDEFSMVDQWLFYNLLKACKSVKKILIIGDEDQLPSVGIGCVLKDLIECHEFPLLRLEKIYRQCEGSDVIELAHEIRQGKCEQLTNSKEVAFFECKNYQIKDQILKIIQSAFDKGYNQQQIQVLAPMYSGVSGIDQLNLSIQKMCNPYDPMKAQLQVGYKLFRENDKILQLKNWPDQDVYNGDIGQIEEVVEAKYDFNHQNRLFCDFDGINVEYTAENFMMLTHAYCISIHKAQGSEYPIVILPIVREHQRMLNRRLIYTAITRAKRSLVILGEKEVLVEAIQRSDELNRLTTLQKRIKNLFE